jgi:hypothetical protein
VSAKPPWHEWWNAIARGPDRASSHAARCGWLLAPQTRTCSSSGPLSDSVVSHHGTELPPAASWPPATDPDSARSLLERRPLLPSLCKDMATLVWGSLGIPASRAEPDGSPGRQSVTVARLLSTESVNNSAILWISPVGGRGSCGSIFEVVRAESPITVRGDLRRAKAPTGGRPFRAPALRAR